MIRAWKQITAVAVAFAQLVAFVEAHSNAPGTCNVDDMASIGHGPSLRPACPNCYSVFVHAETNKTSPSRYTITLSSTTFPTYRGLLLYAQDPRNRTFGNFTAYDQALFAPVECEDAVSFDIPSTLGQVDGKDKRWPVTVGWNPGEVLPAGQVAGEGQVAVGEIVTVKGMVVIDYDTFHNAYHILPPFSFVLQSPTTSFADIAALRRVELRALARSGNASANATGTATSLSAVTSAISTSAVASTHSSPAPVTTVANKDSHTLRDNTLFICITVLALLLYAAGNYALARLKKADIEKRSSRNKMKGTSAWGPAALAAGVVGVPPPNPSMSPGTLVGGNADGSTAGGKKLS